MTQLLDYSLAISPMIIEFIGAPGAGKTTLMPTVMAFFQEQGLQAYKVVEAARPFAQRTPIGKLIALAPAAWRRPLLWQLFYRLSAWRRRHFRRQHSQLMAHVLQAQIGRPAEADVAQRKVLYWFDHLTGYYEFLRAYVRADEALVLDEGFVHRVVQLFSSSVEAPKAEQIATYLDLVPRPDLVIFADTPREICEERIYSRGLWDRARHKNAAEISQFVSHAHLAVSLATNYMCEQGWAMITVDNGRHDISATQADLYQKLQQFALKPTQLEVM